MVIDKSQKTDDNLFSLIQLSGTINTAKEANVAAHDVFLRKIKWNNLLLWLVLALLIIASIICIAMMFSTLPTSAEESETAETTIRLLRELEPGDFVELRDGQIFVVPKTPRANNPFTLILANAVAAPKQYSTTPTAAKTRRIIKTSDEDWPSYARAFLIPAQKDDVP